MMKKVSSVIIGLVIIEEVMLQTISKKTVIIT